MAEFIDQDEPVYALIGFKLPPELHDEKSPVQVLVADGAVRDYHEELEGTVDFFTTPRSESEAKTWLTEAGAPQGTLERLVDGKHLVRIPSVGSFDAVKPLKDLRIVPIGVPIPELDEDDGLVFVGPVQEEQNSPPPVMVTYLLARVLWDSALEDDVPSAVKKFARELDIPREIMGRLALLGLDRLLSRRLARFEWVNLPQG